MTPAPQSPEAGNFPPPPANASTCPKCQQPATPQAGSQLCSKCGVSFVLLSGALMDPSVKVPLPDPAAKELKLKAPGLIVQSVAMLKPDAIGFGALDPILGRFPMDEKGVRFSYLYSIAAWKELNLAQALTFFFLSLPIFLAGLAILVLSPGVVKLMFGVPLMALGGFHGYRVFGTKAIRMRVVGFKDRTIDMTFVGSPTKRQRFFDEFCRRAGLQQSQLP